MDILPITESQLSLASSPIRLRRVVQESLWFWWRQEITIFRLVVLRLVCDFG